MQKNVEGLFFEEAHSAYHADQMHEIPSLSASLAKLIISDTMRHCWWSCARLNPQWEPKYKKIWDRGSAAHIMLLGAGAEIVRVQSDSWRTKDAKAQREAARERRAIPVLESEFSELTQMREMLPAQLAELEGGDPFITGAPEVVMRWREEFVLHGKIYSVWCKARLDWFNFECENLYDLKTSEMVANPAKWTRYSMWDMGAPYQAAMYRRGIRRLSQLGILKAYDPDFLFLLVESKPPFSISLVSVPSDITAPYSHETADERVLQAMVKWHDCLEAGTGIEHWPGYPTSVFVAKAIGARSNAQPQWHTMDPTKMPTGHLESQEMPDEAYTPITFPGAKR